MRQAVIGKKERLTGAILDVDVIIVKGSVDGSITADVVELRSSARVRGNIRYRTLSVARGAHIDAVLQRKD